MQTTCYVFIEYMIKSFKKRKLLKLVWKTLHSLQIFGDFFKIQTVAPNIWPIAYVWTLFINIAVNGGQCSKEKKNFKKVSSSSCFMFPRSMRRHTLSVCSVSTSPNPSSRNLIFGILPKKLGECSAYSITQEVSDSTCFALSLI